MQLLSCKKFFAVDDKTGTGTVDTSRAELNSDSIYDALGAEESDVIPLEDKKSGSKKATPKEEIETDEEQEKDESDDESSEEELDELTELEQEIAEPTDEQLELTTPVKRREILAKYPNIFKEFPYLEKAYYREQQFTEIYPTINDAKVAQEKSEAFDEHTKLLMSGDTKEILKVIKGEDANAFNQIVDNYMTSLYEVDQTAYYHVLSNISKTTIAHMAQVARSQNNEELAQAALILHKFIFGDVQWTPPARLAKQVSQDTENVNNERVQYVKQRYEDARTDLRTRLENSIQSTIEQNIDGNGSMTPYVKKAAVADAMNSLQRLINSDTRFQTLQRKLWEAAIRDGFSKASTDRIRSAFVAQAKTLLPAVIKRARNEALKGLGKRVKDDSEDVNDGSTRTQKTGKTTSPNSGRTHVEKAKSIPKGMTTLEYLNKD